MSFKEVYITKTASFFPNDPVSNDEMETYLGFINDQPSKSKRIVLRNNGIKRRFYALTKEGKTTHTNAEMTALAIKALFDNDPEKLKKIDLLSCGTSSPDQVMPSHAVMTHGWLPETGNIEVVSPSGVCCAGMHALKYAVMAVKTGEAETAVAAGSERMSGLLRHDQFEDEVQQLIKLEQNPYISFEKEFLRWMLSDGASAFLLSDKKNEDGLSLRVDWIEGASYANEREACMYMGATKNSDGTLTSFMDHKPEDLLTQSVFSIKQDVKLLSDNIIKLGGRNIRRIFDKKGETAESVTYFLPHMSSAFFKDKIMAGLIEHNIDIPYEKWRFNLPTVGNVGAASAYLMVDELFRSGELKKGERILLLVPESSRFSYMFCMMTVV